MKAARLVAILIALTFAPAAFAGTLRWTECGNSVSVTYEEVRQARREGKALLGYVKDLLQKSELCYEGRDYEAIDILVNGLNQTGTEACDQYIMVHPDGRVVVGPCYQITPEPPTEFYELAISPCRN